MTTSLVPSIPSHHPLSEKEVSSTLSLDEQEERAYSERDLMLNDSQSTASMSLTPENPIYCDGKNLQKGSSSGDSNSSSEDTPPTAAPAEERLSLDETEKNASIVTPSALNTGVPAVTSNTDTGMNDYTHLDFDEPEPAFAQHDPRLQSGRLSSGELDAFEASQESQGLQRQTSPHQSQQNLLEAHHFHFLGQIREDQVSVEGDLSISSGCPSTPPSPPHPPLSSPLTRTKAPADYFDPYFASSKFFYRISLRVFEHDDFCLATWIGFWALFLVTCANYVLTPIRDAVALQVGVKHIPNLTLASSVLALFSSVPIGWLFEAPDPSRRKLWKKMGLTRGETQGTSLALFYRFFALSLISYAIGFKIVELGLHSSLLHLLPSWFSVPTAAKTIGAHPASITESLMEAWSTLYEWVQFVMSQLGYVIYIAFFLVVHLMKLHSLSLVWGVTSEAMEYEDVARKGHEQRPPSPSGEQDEKSSKKSKTRLQQLALVGFGGTVGGILGSVLASSMANTLSLSGLLILAALLLEIAAELSIELGRIMQKHWEEQQIFKSCQDLASLDTSMKRSTSVGSMKRVASGNSLFGNNMKRVASGNSIGVTSNLSSKSLSDMDKDSSPDSPSGATSTAADNNNKMTEVDDNTFTQRLLRGITTILSSRLLMAIFTYNALYASTSVLLSFQRAALVANRNASTTVSADTAFLANINIASSVAVFVMQASGLGAYLAQKCGPRGSLALMPVIRLLGVLSLAWWHQVSGGKPPNLILFLMLDECTRVVNLAIAKPVRESLWRGLSNEARYEAKPIVDTLANRWGGGSAAFVVSIIEKALVLAGITTVGSDPSIFGLPPVLFLCMIVAAWWSMVSVDLGQIRKRIDLELKKRQ